MRPSLSMTSILKASILAAVILAFCGQGSAQTARTPQLSDADKAAIINIALDLWFARAAELANDQGAELLKYNTLSTEDMSANLVSQLSGIKLVLREPKQIKKLSRQATAFRYLRLGDFTSKGNSIGFTLGAISQTNGLPLGAHSYQYLFENIAGQWLGKMTIIIC
jgi:hypothetical protein